MSETRIFRWNMFTFRGPGVVAGVRTDWAHHLEPVGDRRVPAGMEVELLVTVDAARHPLSADTSVRFDIYEENYLLSADAADRIVSLVGTGADPPGEDFPTEPRTTVYRTLEAGQEIGAFVEEYVRQNRDTYASQLLVVEEDAAETRRFHILTWWTALRLPERLTSRFYFVADIGDSIRAQHLQMLDVGAEAAEEGAVRLELRYRDDSPMANAAFEVVKGQRRVMGFTDRQGTAVLDMPIGEEESCRFFLRSYPQREVPDEQADEVTDLSPEVLKSFGFDSAFPPPVFYEHLKRVRDVVRREPDVEPLIFGHTDSAGSVSYNLGLSRRRARAVFALLTDQWTILDELAAQEQWGFRVYQSMLRGLGNNPGPIDGQNGDMTQAAVEAFQEEYNRDVFHQGERERAHPDLVVDGDLGTLTKAALRDSYASMAPHVDRERFAGPGWVGCSENHPVSGEDGENRRAVVAFLQQPLAQPLPDGEAELCGAYEQLVGEVGDEPRGARCVDFHWLKAETTVHLSALTSLPENTAARFIVFRSSEAVSLPPPYGREGETPPPVEEEFNQLEGETTTGVCFARWQPPPGYDPFDSEDWWRNHDVQLEIFDEADEEEPGAEDDANASNLWERPAMSPPLFRIDGADSWHVSEPPGQRLNRMDFSDSPDVSDASTMAPLSSAGSGGGFHTAALPPTAKGVAMRSDGGLLDFDAEDNGRVRAPYDAPLLAYAQEPEEGGAPPPPPPPPPTCARYGGFLLQRGDHEPSAWDPRPEDDPEPAEDARPVYGGSPRSGSELPAPGDKGFIRLLQEDLAELGFGIVGNPDGDFRRKTFWGVREFQIYAGMPNVAQENTTLPATTAYVERLSQQTNTQIYTGHISGVLNAETCRLIQHWRANHWRCPVIIQARSGAGHANIFNDHNNIWLHDEVSSGTPRMFARDFSGYYTLPGFPTHRATLTVGGAPVTGLNFQPTVLPPLGSISGQVTDGSGTGVFAAQVTATDSAGGALPTVQTDVSGNYTIRGVPPAQYDVTLMAAGFQDPAALTVTVAKGQGVTGRDFQLSAPTAQVSISGRVTEMIAGTASGVANVRVTAVAGGTSTAVLTDSNGDYAITGLAAGTYTVNTRALGFADASNASVVVISGTGTPDVDFSLTDLPTSSISGRVTDGTGAGLAAARLDAVHTETGAPLPTTVAAANGDYTIAASPGAYSISVQPVDLLYLGDSLINSHHYMVIGDFATYLSWEGPRSMCGMAGGSFVRHTWREAELMAADLVGEKQAALTAAQLSTFKVVRAVSEVECYGFFDSVNSYDNAFASLGPCHWTLAQVKRSAPALFGKGELVGYLSYLRFIDTHAFNAAIERFGAGVDTEWDHGGTGDGSSLFTSSIRTYGGFMTLQDETGNFVRFTDGLPVLEQEGETNYFKTWHWFYRLVMAGRTIEGFRRRMWDMARVRLRDILAVPFPTGASWPAVGTRPATIGEVYTSERAVALILRWHIKSPSHVVRSGEVRTTIASSLGSAFRTAFPAGPGAGLIAGWGDAEEQLLINGIITASAADLGQTMAQVRDWPTYAGRAGRGYKLTAAIGALSTDRDSFDFEAAGLPVAPP